TLSLFLLSRTLIQSVDNNLSSASREVASTASKLAGQPEVPGGDSFTPVEYAVEIRDDSGQTVVEDVVLYNDDEVSISFPQLTDKQILQLGGRPFTIKDSVENRWRVVAMVNTAPDGGTVYV